MREKASNIVSSAASQAISVAGILLVAGCSSHTYSPVWQSITIQKGAAWHNEGSQQTAFDQNSDGRIDRLRYWRGSGIARELHDQNNDGWFDTLVVIVYDNERSRTNIRVRAPLIPKTGSIKSFEIPELYDTNSQQAEHVVGGNGG